MAYRCIECMETFDEPAVIRYCKDDYNGVAGLFGNWQYGHYEACPACGSEEFVEIEEDIDEEALEGEE